MLLVHALEHDGHGYRTEKDQYDDSCEIVRRDKSYRKAGFRCDQGNLASGHHADTDLEGIIEAESAELGDCAAAYDLRDAGDRYESD